MGGPIKKDALWFFGSGRFFIVNKPIANTYVSDGTRAGIVACANALAGRGGTLCPQGVDPQHQYSGLVRITWQMSPRNKLSGYYDRIHKVRGAAMGPGDDQTTSSVQWNSPLYTTNMIKYTSTVSSKLLVEGGFSSNIERYNNLYPEGIEKEYGSAAVARQRPSRRRRRRLDQHRVGSAVRQLSGSLQHAGVGLVCHRIAGLQGRVPGFVGSVQPEPARQRRSLPELRDQRAGHPGAVDGDAARDAVALAGSPEREPRHLRPGRDDLQAGDDHPRRPLRVHQPAGHRPGRAGRPLREHPGVRRHPDADLEDVLAAHLDRLRPDGQRQDGGPLRLQPLRRRRDDDAGVAVRPGGRHDDQRDRAVDRQERRRHRAGRATAATSRRSELRDQLRRASRPTSASSRWPARIRA